jgi:hypothetical protein
VTDTGAVPVTIVGEETMARFRYEVGELLAVSRAMAAERDIRKLLGLILTKAREITAADAGANDVITFGKVAFRVKEVTVAAPRADTTSASSKPLQAPTTSAFASLSAPPPPTARATPPPVLAAASKPTTKASAAAGASKPTPKASAAAGPTKPQAPEPDPFKP